MTEYPSKEEIETKAWDFRMHHLGKSGFSADDEICEFGPVGKLIERCFISGANWMLDKWKEHEGDDSPGTLSFREAMSLYHHLLGDPEFPATKEPETSDPSTSEPDPEAA